MKKTCLLLLALLVTLNISSVYAATFTLDKIGALNTDGHRYTEWWYTGKAPALSGTSTSGTKITIFVDDASSEVTVGETGTWSFTPTALETGDHKFVLNSVDDSYTFTLHLGQTMPAGGTASTPETTQSTVPVTGEAQVLAVLGGTVALALGWYLLSNRKDSAFLE